MNLRLKSIKGGWLFIFMLELKYKNCRQVAAEIFDFSKYMNSDGASSWQRELTAVCKMSSHK